MFALDMKLFYPCNIWTPREMLSGLLIERTLPQPRKFDEYFLNAAKLLTCLAR